MGEVLTLLLGLCFPISTDLAFPQTLLFSLRFGCDRDGCTSGMTLVGNILPCPGGLCGQQAGGEAPARAAGDLRAVRTHLGLSSAATAAPGRGRAAGAALRVGPRRAVARLRCSARAARGELGLCSGGAGLGGRR